jgi:hypothetical protein
VPSGTRILVDCVQQYCYCRDKKYCPRDDADLTVGADFAYVIQVKDNAPELLRWALSRVPVDVVATGDYQPAEKRFGVSRRMLEVLLELGFAVSVLERSPLVLRDLDLLKEIDQQAPSAAWSIDDRPQALGLPFCQMGAKGLEDIENVGARMAGITEELIQGSAKSEGLAWKAIEP